MNANDTIVTALQRAMRGESLDSEVLLPAVSAAMASQNLHELGCQMLNALIEHVQVDIRAQRALLLVQMGRSDHA